MVLSHFDFSNEAEVVKRVTVRLLADHERPEFDRLLLEKHYLHDARLAGQSLRYVAEVAGQWLALLSCSATALHLKGREKWITWSPRQRARRLPFVVNNSRFLVLPERARFPNLASRVLGLVLRRLRADWQARWPRELADCEAEVTGPCPFRAPALAGLLDRLGALPDARRGHGLRHRQRFVLACAAVATLMGACGYRAFENTCQKMTQRQLRAPGCQPAEEDGRYYPPSDTTFQRVLKRMDAAAVATLIGGWLAEQEIGALARLAVDGKVLRGSGRHDGKALQLLSAVTHHLRLTLDQLPIEEKSNEIPALKPLLLKVKPPPGTLITADALHCQQESARFITQELGGDYLFGLKGNQSGILDKAQRLLAQQGFPPSRAVGKGPRTA